MPPAAHIEIFREGRWLPAARLEPLGDDLARVDYLPDYIFSDDPWPISLALPVGFAPPRLDGPLRAPAFLYDLVPQGRGRRLLLQLLGRADDDRLVLPLLLAGAFNPVGALRVDQAVDFYHAQAQLNPPAPGAEEGFTRRQLGERSDNVLEHLSTHALLASGSTGVQGVSPKYLLTEDAEGRLHADMALPDARARRHWLVKGPRNASAEDRMVLRNEAAYLRVAAACGIRVHAVDQVLHQDNLLHLPRFDRLVGPDGVQRLHQESLASLAGLAGFGLPCRLNQLLEGLRRHATDPQAETLEFVRRDVLNQALRNTDNHARNHAVQRLPDGRVRLTPLYDFAPMFLDPELVPRSTHWANAAGRRLHAWSEVLDTLAVADDEREELRKALRAFAPVVGQLPETMQAQGVEAAVIEACRASIDSQAKQLEAL
ncbi:HipA domain-containing protein [Arenimonas sp. SCN 70-307]|uniref:type II toxin-antitoxin system HipA family toxin n=1 Tax=Arenimonas sp. SCN 70-307 TaxID=1660089 RepID=UPI000A683F44|nr:HipA domain-containing protein [Arenimonas sp. SCN 70-307]